MPRYFIEVAYKGTAYAGFQVQENAVTIQSELQKALAIFFRQPVPLTGSSRTDAGVHALQNFFHFDLEGDIPAKVIYNINAILPPDIAVKNIVPVSNDAHCRFDAVSREYRYFVYHTKNPFLPDRSYFFPYPLNKEKLQEAAAVIKEYTDFTSFSKRNTQVKTFNCSIMESEWQQDENGLVYNVKSNRFLRGMVRGLTGTMLQVGRGKIDIPAFRTIIEKRDCTLADFAVPAHGLFLCRVNY
ncbi:MAG: tRNA pseudouridine(38-40) synthase TruA [Chitinophagaceae bacterium]|nr:tRNA pseudouridine(38-40) synthase TruA [Chitinophagaceae bacterium]